MPNTDFLFALLDSVFTLAQVNSYFGHSTRSANAQKWFMGEWLQTKGTDDMYRLLADEEEKYAGLDRVASNVDYAPYGRPEPRLQATPTSGNGEDTE